MKLEMEIILQTMEIHPGSSFYELLILSGLDELTFYNALGNLIRENKVSILKSILSPLL